MRILTSKLNLDDAEKVEVALINEDTGESISKKISLSAYLKMLDRVDDGTMREIPRLPVGTLGGLKYVNESTFYIEVYVDADVHPTAYIKEENIVFLPFPSLLFMIGVTAGKMSVSRVYAVKECYRQVTADTELFMFPYGNVYQTGKICWGGNYDVFDVDSVTDVELVIERFFSAIMNNDLYHNNTKKNVPLEQLIRENVKKGKFDNDSLVVMGTLSNLRNLSC